MSSKLNRQNEYLYLLRNHKGGLTIVILGLLFCALFVSPIGEFAINDDWSYAHNVKALYDRGEFEFSDWPAMTLIGQTIPAWIWSECFGLSFLNLRLLTLLFALGTLFFVYAIIGSVTDKRTATIGSLLVLVNPIFLALSFTFMTEVYYLFYLTGMLYFSHRYFKCRQKGDFAIMLLFFVLAILTRQIALLFAPVFGLVCLLSHKRNLRTIILAVMPLVLGLLAIIGYKWFRIGTGSGMGTFSSIGSLIKGIDNYPLSHYLQRLGLILLYIGLLTVPLHFIMWRVVKETITSKWLTSIFLFLLLGILMYSARQLFPIGNVLESIGIGPHLLKDVPAGLHANAASKTIWNILFVAAFVNGLFLISTYIITSLRSLSRMKESSPFELTLIGLAFAELIYLIINPIFFDRYVLTVSILFGLWFFRNFRISSRWNYLVLIVAISLPLILVSDFMKWQRSRNRLTNRALIIFGAKQEQIDGGFEYNAWHKVAPIGEVTYDRDAKSWWFVADDQYIIASTAALNNYKPIDSLRTLTWINPLEKVYILKRDK